MDFDDPFDNPADSENAHHAALPEGANLKKVLPRASKMSGRKPF